MFGVNQTLAFARWLIPVKHLRTTVDSHRKNLLTKFDAKNTALLIRTASQLHFI